MSAREKRLETFRKSQTKRAKIKKEKGYEEMGEVLDFKFKKSHV